MRNHRIIAHVDRNEDHPKVILVPIMKSFCNVFSICSHYMVNLEENVKQNMHINITYAHLENKPKRHLKEGAQNCVIRV
jgi:hypothetical protein